MVPASRAGEAPGGDPERALMDSEPDFDVVAIRCVVAALAILVAADAIKTCARHMERRKAYAACVEHHAVDLCADVLP